MNKTKTKNLYLENALKYKEKFGLDFIPVIITERDKRPVLNEWEHLQVVKQSIEELKSYNWKMANGFGMINKIIATLDFDKCDRLDFVRSIVSELGGNYWIVKTGKGYHIHIIIEDIENLSKILGKKGIHKLRSKNITIVEHIEIRAYGCYSTFPHSKHYSGTIYAFINGEPDVLPDKISAHNLIEVLRQYFIIDEKKENDKEKNQAGFYEDFNNGVEEGNRHNTLVKLFGAFYSRGIDKKYLSTMLKDWNNKNKPPLPVNVLIKQINDLFRRYEKGIDGIFLQFNSCLLQLEDDYKLKLEKIICYAVIEFDGEKKIIEELGLEQKINEYHSECKTLVKHYEKWTGKKDQIVRIGKTLLLDTLNKKIRFDYFCIYAGILSYLGRNRNKPAQKISYSNIQYRAMGYKNENEFLRSGSTIRPYKLYTVRKAIEFLTEANFIRKFVLVKGQMIWFSTFITTYEELAEYVKNYELKKLKKERDKEEIRLRVLDEIRNEENELKDLKNKKKMNDPSSTTSSSIHLLSNEG